MYIYMYIYTYIYIFDFISGVTYHVYEHTVYTSLSTLISEDLMCLLLACLMCGSSCESYFQIVACLMCRCTSYVRVQECVMCTLQSMYCAGCGHGPCRFAPSMPRFTRYGDPLGPGALCPPWYSTMFTMCTVVTGTRRCIHRLQEFIITPK